MDLPTLRNLIDQYFNNNDLRDLCFDLGDVDYENLPGEGKSAKARELVAHMNRRGRLPELVALCRKLRPHVVWPDSTQSTPPVQQVPLTTPLIKASPEEEHGLEELAKRLANAGVETLAELATLADRLRTNRREERLFGSSENSRNDHARIIYALNEFAVAHCAISFNELCRG